MLDLTAERNTIKKTQIDFDEKEVPELLKNYEFLWRLKSDTFRRLKRIIETLVYYLKGKYINKIFDNIRFINID